MGVARVRRTVPPEVDAPPQPPDRRTLDRRAFLAGGAAAASGAALTSSAGPASAGHVPSEPTSDRPPPSHDLITYEEARLAFCCHGLHLEPLDRPITPLGFPVAAAAQAGSAGLVDGSVTEVTADGRRVLWSRFLGGVGIDVPNSLARDLGGNAHVAGRTDSRDPVRRAVQPEFGGCIDGFATTLAARTGQLARSTLISGAEADGATGVDTHRPGGQHLTGRTLSPDFPTSRPFQPTPAKDDDFDAVLRKGK